MHMQFEQLQEENKQVLVQSGQEFTQVSLTHSETNLSSQLFEVPDNQINSIPYVNTYEHVARSKDEKVVIDQLCAKAPAIFRQQVVRFAKEYYKNSENLLASTQQDFNYLCDLSPNIKLWEKKVNPLYLRAVMQSSLSERQLFEVGALPLYYVLRRSLRRLACSIGTARLRCTTCCLNTRAAK